MITKKNKFFMFFKKLFIVPLIMETLYKTIHYSSWYIYLYKIINSRNLFSCYFLYNIPPLIAIQSDF